MRISWKTAFTLLPLFCSAITHAGQAVTSIEDEDLGSVPDNVRNAINADKSFKDLVKLNCDLKGILIALSKNNQIESWFVTTSEACGWGAALAPIWIVSEISEKNLVLLATGGFALRTLKSFHHGMVDIVVLDGTAGKERSRKYVYNGISYKFGHPER